jgi:hypothetical protein
MRQPNTVESVVFCEVRLDKIPQLGWTLSNGIHPRRVCLWQAIRGGEIQPLQRLLLSDDGQKAEGD